jgi:hypothetical protein
MTPPDPGRNESMQLSDIEKIERRPASAIGSQPDFNTVNAARSERRTS